MCSYECIFHAESKYGFEKLQFQTLDLLPKLVIYRVNNFKVGVMSVLSICCCVSNSFVLEYMLICWIGFPHNFW